jgi:hypothetical protein|tara:strand:- start:339 stop:602 length:264 start_codon:yes stop_codon:yes gene_type:complete
MQRHNPNLQRSVEVIDAMGLETGRYRVANPGNFCLSSAPHWVKQFPPDPNPPGMSMLPGDYTKKGQKKKLKMEQIKDEYPKNLTAHA